MLALKVVLAAADRIPTLVFDEVDAGIGGRAAQAVAAKLSYLARNFQVLCITHLPQIASVGDCHFAISKEMSGGRTRICLESLNQTPSERNLPDAGGGTDRRLPRSTPGNAEAAGRPKRRRGRRINRGMAEENDFDWEKNKKMHSLSCTRSAYPLVRLSLYGNRD